MSLCFHLLSKCKVNCGKVVDRLSDLVTLRLHIWHVIQASRNHGYGFATGFIVMLKDQASAFTFLDALNILGIIISASCCGWKSRI